jgi:dihydroceramide fatty acyl 2-hydroxylase
MRAREQGTTIRAFDSPLLERLSRVHPLTPLLVWPPVAMLLLVTGLTGVSVPASLGLWVAGLFVWTFSEYVLHRWVFHWVGPTEGLRRLWYPVHHMHHDVQERDRLLAPPLLSIPLFFVFLGLFSWWPGAPWMYPLFSGFIVGYLAYDYIHFYTHFARPRSALGKGLRRRHLQHHFAFEDRWFGVSTPLWDYVFRTHVREGERSVTWTSSRSATPSTSSRWCVPPGSIRTSPPSTRPSAPRS